MSDINLGNLTNLFPDLNSLVSLKVLLISGCGLQNSPDYHVHSNLSSLEILDISSNEFRKPIKPNWFWDLTSLKQLDISYNQFSGMFPDEIGNMTSMRSLDLSQNNLVGMIPSNLKNLCSLEQLKASGNNISGSISEIFQLLPSCSWNRLSWLSLSNSSLTGSIPTKLGPLRNLVVLDLSENHLIGHLPLWIGGLTKLKDLNLQQNNLDGVIHEGHLSGLASLETMWLYDNSIAIAPNSTWVPPSSLTDIVIRSCFLGPEFPLWLRWPMHLYRLDISNTSISDIVPDSFWITASSVDSLMMGHNQLSGYLPSTMEFMTSFKMDLSSNNFSGPIPKLPVNLTDLDLSGNKFSSLPFDFGAPRLATLHLPDNSISGTIPSSLCKLESLMILDLSRNKLTGSIPDCLVNQSTTKTTSLSITHLSLTNNKLSGDFPSFLQRCKQLIVLDLAYNQFSGTLPSWIGEKLSSLVFLRLRSNMFYGHIPVELTMLTNLQFLDLSYNNISGHIPKSIVNYTGMIRMRDPGSALTFVLAYMHYDPAHYGENFTVVTKGQERLYTGEIVYMVNLDLSCNSITGDIPEEIGTLVALKSLNLSWNDFSSKIPDKIGSLVQVESLDLSHNELSGRIPTSLSALTSLSHLNLSYNNLTGGIPSGNQLQALDDQESIYVGNPGLCGPMISKKCLGTELIPATLQHHEDVNDTVSFLIAMGSGCVMGLWVVFCTFLFKRKWRICWFSFCDSLYDRVYVQVAVGWASRTRHNTVGRS
jgi:Leucine-rich repeat (LRR) protein